MTESALTSRVNVYVRCRPLSITEQRGRKCVAIREDANSLQIGEKTFSFQGIFDENTDQVTIYQKCVQNLIDGCFDGYNATVFACKYILIIFFVDEYTHFFCFRLLYH
jgi:kinesin family protein 4/21/27